VVLYRAYKKPYRSALFVGSSSVSDFRMSLAARGLAELGWYTELELTTLATWQASRFDVVVSARPNLEISRILMDWMRGRTKIVVDLDDDFTSIPPHNPAYNVIGPGNTQGYLGVLKEVVGLATGFTTSTAEVGSRYKRPSMVIPNTWDERNLFTKFGRWPAHAGINIGWTGTKTHRADFKLVEPALKRILAEREDVGIVIGLDEELYEGFRYLPPSRRMFIPALPYECYPLTFFSIDILVCPLEDNRFNRAKSDNKLIDAACQGVPWVASPVLPYLEAKGGMFAGSVDEWYEKLVLLIEDDEMRKAAGLIGKEWAWGRRSEVYAGIWEGYLSSLL
jgi:hypothetical protein